MITFIILNYKSLKDTKECINSIKKIDNQEMIKIIVVDNASMNEKEIEEVKDICDDFIYSEKNLGFAKGNNLGASYAIEKYHPDFLCVINSDIIINQKNFINEIINLNKEYNFDVLGPKILPLELDSRNPFPAYKEIEQVEQKIKYTKKIIKIYKNPILRNLLNIYLSLKSKLIKKETKEIIEEERLNVPLHGCALIFSKKYYEKFNNVFYNETFLFHEEEFLYYRCKKNNLVSLYSPRIELIHKEGQSLDKSFDKDYKKMIFRNEEILKSLLLLEKVMKEDLDI